MQYLFWPFSLVYLNKNTISNTGWQKRKTKLKKFVQDITPHQNITIYPPPPPPKKKLNGQLPYNMGL